MTKKVKDLEIRFSDTSIEEHLREWFNEPGVLRWYPCQEKKEVEDTVKMLTSFTRWRCALTAFVKDKPVGFAVLFLHAYKKIAHQCLFGMLVDSDYRNQGIGTQLVMHILELGKKNFNLEVMYLEVFEGNPAINLYRRLGFREVGYHKYWLKEDDGSYRSKIVMEKVLN